MARVVTVLAFSVFFGLRAFNIFVRVFFGLSGLDYYVNKGYLVASKSETEVKLRTMVPHFN